MVTGATLATMGWLAAFTTVGYWIYIGGYLATLVGLALVPSLKRTFTAAGILTLYLYYVGVLILVALGIWSLLSRSRHGE